MLGTDRELLAAWRVGDSEAGGRLLRRHFACLSSFFRNRGCRDLSDLIQKTLLGCVESKARVPPEVPFRVYLLGIARRVLMQYYREQKQHRRLGGRDPAEGPEFRPSPPSQIELRQEQRLLLACLRRLPIDLQLTVELHYWEQLKVREIAVILEIPSGTVKYRLSRARALIRAEIFRAKPAPVLLKSTLSHFDHWATQMRVIADLPGALSSSRARL